jgi:ATP-dependent DNA ligase
MPPDLKISPADLMHSTPAKAPFRDPAWLFEQKYDGIRILAAKTAAGVSLITKGGRNVAAQFPEVAAALAKMRFSIVLDGELIVCNDAGQPHFERVQRRNLLQHPQRILEAARLEPACVMAFDLLWWRGEDYRGFPLVARKAVLGRALRTMKGVKVAPFMEDDGIAMYAGAVAADLEGIIAKRKSSIYRPGKSAMWQKIKTPAGKARDEKRLRHLK